MATRAKKIVISNVSHEEAEQAMGTFAQCNTQLKLIESRMEEEKQQVDNKFLSGPAPQMLIFRERSRQIEGLLTLRVSGESNEISDEACAA